MINRTKIITYMPDKWEDTKSCQPLTFYFQTATFTNYPRGGAYLGEILSIHLGGEV